ncbi:DnaJ domain-containing protein [Nannocystis sp. ILAH1]|uniref:DnaJ domain-containing protein n=1 Tax=Nannocystis sp. ILAH1 TaxID=2996789 RepID=UPI00226F7169|nr:DnaJ domain-containing protein [Nannocystis sp. ILAH1]MCY0994338.1 DnaJ domain-containing protein [Nannocystis sp. ILAH1]
MSTLYDTLGVTRTAAAAEIKAAYRKLTQQLHPDKNPGDHEAEERFKQVTGAYEVLGDPSRRKLYDEFGEPSLSRGFDPKVARAARRGPERGADLGVEIDLPLLVALRGGSFEQVVDRSPQPSARVKLTVPAGCSAGQRLKLSGLGRPGSPAGDLWLTIRDFLPDPRWRLVEVREELPDRAPRLRRDLVGRLDVPLGAVYSGSSVLVEHAPWGPLSVTLPPRALDPVRVPGHGWRDPRGQTTGDLVLELVLRWPRPDPMLDAMLRNARY